MNLLDEIKLYYASLDKNRVRVLKSINPFITYLYMDSSSYAVVIPVDENYPLYFDEFSGFIIQTIEMLIENKTTRVLMLKSKSLKNLDQFVIIANNFSDPGLNGILRQSLLNNPLEWSNNWKQFFGNQFINKESYDIFGELIIYDYLYGIDKTVKWTALDRGTHDFESIGFSYEVKTTTNKYESIVTISSQNQLHSHVPIKLFYVKVEKNPNGICIDEALDSLKEMGIDVDIINTYLEKNNLQKGKIERKDKYVILEKREYLIDTSFPQIFPEEFESLKHRNRILKLTYTIDLSGIEYQSF